MQCAKCKAMVPSGSTHCVVCQTPITHSTSNKKLNISLGFHKSLHDKFSSPNHKVNLGKGQKTQTTSSGTSDHAPLNMLSPHTPQYSSSSKAASGGGDLSMQDPLKDFLSSGGILDQKFKLNREIGRGGMGFVYLATDISLNRQVAIKILPPHYNDDQAVVGRFQREARAMASLDHANIVTVYTIGFYANLHYFAMKYLPGETLAHTLKRVVLGRRSALSALDIIDLMIQACNGLEHAHSKSLLHRDIKPGNLMLSPEGRLCIMDFGIVKRLDDSDSLGLKTAHGKIFGTPEYMPPEQAMGKGDYSPASDLYALAVVGYELLCGELPYVADTPIGIIIQHIRAEVPMLKGRARHKYPLLEEIFRKCLAKKSQSRYASAAELRTALIGVQQKLSAPNFQEVPNSNLINHAEDDFEFIDEIDSLMFEEDELFSQVLKQSALTGSLSSRPLSTQPTPSPIGPNVQSPSPEQRDPKPSQTPSTQASSAVQVASSATVSSQASPIPVASQPSPTPMAPQPSPTPMAQQIPSKQSAPETLPPHSSQVSELPTLGLESRPTTNLKPASSRPGHYTRLPIKRK